MPVGPKQQRRTRMMMAQDPPSLPNYYVELLRRRDLENRQKPSRRREYARETAKRVRGGTGRATDPIPPQSGRETDIAAADIQEH